MAENENTEEQRLESATVVGYIDQPHLDKTPTITKSSTITTYRFFHAFQYRARAILDGYTGRSYHIRAESSERCDSVAATIMIANSSKKGKKSSDELESEPISEEPANGSNLRLPQRCLLSISYNQFDSFGKLDQNCTEFTRMENPE